MFLRFVRKSAVLGLRSREGFFAPAYELLNHAHLESHARDELQGLLAWFRNNLAVPTKFSRSSSKGSYRRDTTSGLSWFKPTAQSHLEKARQLTNLVELHGHAIEVLKTKRPGYIIYEDEHQIVAQPFADENWFG